jgi:hypothetical protein
MNINNFLEDRKMNGRTNLKTWLVISVFLLAAGIGTSSVFATGTYNGGNGSEGSPFEINTPAQMDEIGQHSEDWGSYFILTADIDLSAYTGTAFHIIGTLRTPFTGSFDGDGHTISNFTHTSTGTVWIGLFGYVGNGGEIKDLGMVDVNLDGGYVVGGLVGISYGTVSNCYATGNVTAASGVGGGLVGWNRYGTVSNCYATGNITGERYVGGLVGTNRGTVSNCYAAGNVSGANSVGGLVGAHDRATVSNCYATGSVTGELDVGGLVGRNHYGTVSNCYATASVSGTISHIGGLVGDNYGPVSNCYATGNITGERDVGGLVGRNYGTYYGTGTVSNCYATGSVSGTENVGGLTGKNSYADIFASLWDTQTTGLANGVGFNEGSGTVEVYGRTTAQMQTQSTFTDHGWDFVGETANGTEDIWVLREANYPWLAWEIDLAEDSDDDGIPDNEDNCQETFNPGQSDIDEDGAGDLCDVCPADANDECDPNGSTAEEIDPNEGGTIETPDGDLVIEIDPNDMNEPVTISVTQMIPPDHDVDIMIGTNPGWGQAIAVYDFEPDGLLFNNPVTVTITADVTELNENQRNRLGLYLWDDVLEKFVLVETADCNIVEDPPGTFTKTCTVEVDHFSIYAVILALDTEPPVITCPAEMTLECPADTDPANTGSATATDNWDDAPTITYTDLSSGTCPEVVERTWTAADASSNTSSCIQTIAVQDTTPPVITNPPEDMTVQRDGNGNTEQLNTWLARVLAATDNCGGVSVDNDYTSFPYQCGNTGSLTVTWTATDECGNEATSAATFTIEDPTAGVTYDGDLLLSTGGNPTVNANLLATSKDEQGNQLDIDNEKVTFTLTADGVGTIVLTANTQDGVATVVQALEPAIYMVTVSLECSDYTASGILVVYNPEGGFATGGGWIIPADDGLNTHPKVRANFGFNAKYKQDDPTGHLEFRYCDEFINLKSTSIEQLVITGGKIVQFKGWASVNKEEGHWFFVKAIDNGEPATNDTFDIKIWAPGVDPEGDPSDRAGGVLEGGNIVVHTK